MSFVTKIQRYATYFLPYYFIPKTNYSDYTKNSCKY